MLIRDILQFNKDKYFDGAVQANWFYDTDKVAAIADSYVFALCLIFKVSRTRHKCQLTKINLSVNFIKINPDKFEAG